MQRGTADERVTPPPSIVASKPGRASGGASSRRSQPSSLPAYEGEDATVTLDAHWRIRTWDREAERLFGFPQQAIHGAVLTDALKFQDLFGNPVSCFCGPLREIQQGRSVKPFVIQATAAAGESLRVVVFVSALPAADRSPGLTCRFRPDNRRRQIDRRGLNPESFLLRDDRLRSPNRPRQVALTPAELSVLRLLATGKRADEVAATLCNSILTVRNHIQRILRKLDARNQAQAVSLAIRSGLV